MAYGAKYRLDFSDTEGNKRRLDILQKNYNGFIYPLIGTGAPAILKWEQDNDFYDPIIASNCEINLIQTDAVTYEDFYDFDEREFLVKLYYSETRQANWEDENQNWEAANQTWNLLGAGYNPADEWQNVDVVWDANNGVWEGGIIVDNYQLFWQGFLIQDTYQQKLSAAPFNVSFKAVDGLGLLKGIEFPIAPNNNVTLWQCLHNSLAETGFNADIYVKTNLKEENAAAITNVFEDVIVNSSTYTDENTYKFNTAEVLKSILTGFNCRIFQANGDWVIINNADITTLAAITYRKYNYLGAYDTTKILGEISFIPSDALPIGGDLLKETSGGVIEVSNTVNLDRQLNYIPNGNFEDDFTDWVYDSEFVSIDTNGIKGYKSAKIIGTTNAFENILSNTFLIKAENSIEDNTKFDFSFEVQMQNGGFQSVIARYFVYFQIVVRFREYLTGAYTDNYQTFYYDQLTSVWTETPFVNSFVYSGRGEWLTYNKEITYNCPGVTANYKPYDISFRFSKPKKDAGGAHIATFISGVKMNWKTLLYLDAPDVESETLIFDSKNLETSNSQTTLKKLTNKLEYKDIYQGSSFNRFQKGYMQPIGLNLEGYITKFLRSGDIASKFIEDLTAQQRINDNRLKMERFEGTLKKIDNKYPIQLIDRLFINFNTYVEEKVLVIDTLEFNVKANQYNFNSHLGEQETDVETTFNSSQISYPVVATNQCSTYQVQNNDLLDDVTIGYYDCEGNYQEFTVNADSSSNDFCAETEPFRVAGTTAIEITKISEQCLEDLYYSLTKCSDDTTGWVTAQNTEQITLAINDRVQDASLVDYVVTGEVSEGTSVGTVTDTGEVGCPVPPSLTAFLRSTDQFPNPCGLVPNITAYHDGAGTYPTGGDKVYNTANLTSPLSSGSYLMANNFYISLFGGEPGEVTGVTECTAPIPLHYTLEKCSDSSTGWITGQETTEIALSNNDRVSAGSDLYIVTGTAATGTSVGTVTDTGQTGCPVITNEFVSIWNSGSDKQIKLPLEVSGTYSFDVYWGDGSMNTITSYNQTEVTHYYLNSNTDYTVTISGTIEGFTFKNQPTYRTKFKKVVSWGNLKLGNSGYYFAGNTSVTDFSEISDTLDLTGTTNLTGMFKDIDDVGSINNIENWDVSGVTNMSEMFWGTNFNDNISTWNVGNVTNMSLMFFAANSFNQPIGTWDVSSVIDMQLMFGDALLFNQNLDLWDVSNVTNMLGMFRRAFSFNGDIYSWSVCSVSNMDSMFENAQTFNIDLSNWKVPLIPSEPFKFDYQADDWILPRPGFGESCN